MYPIVSLFGLSLGTYGICCVIGGAFAIHGIRVIESD